MNNIAPQSPVMRRLALQDNLLSPASFVRYPPNTVLPLIKASPSPIRNLDELYQVYSQPGHAYWVVEITRGEVIKGGGGIAPLAGSESDICELQKMYFLPAIRGKGLAKKTGLNGDGASTRDGLQTLLSGNDRFFKGSHCAL